MFTCKRNNNKKNKKIEKQSQILMVKSTVKSFIKVTTVFLIVNEYINFWYTNCFAHWIMVLDYPSALRFLAAHHDVTGAQIYLMWKLSSDCKRLGLHPPPLRLICLIHNMLQEALSFCHVTKPNHKHRPGKLQTQDLLWNINLSFFSTDNRTNETFTLKTLWASIRYTLKMTTYG